MTTQLLAQESAGVLLRSFVIALVVVAPVALWQWNRIRNRRRAVESSNAAPHEAAGTAREQDPRALETIVGSIPELAASTAAGSVVSIEVPPDVTLDGRPASGAIVEQLIRDALARDGLEIIDSDTDPAPNEAGWTVRVRRARPSG
ncbi:MAG: hypothetical protein ACR2OH_13270 [Microthrixaceae bacterium]